MKHGGPQKTPRKTEREEKAYNRYHDHLVSQKVIVQSRQVVPPAAEKLHLCFHFQDQGVSTLDHSQRFLDALLELCRFAREVLGNGFRRIDGDESGDEMHRRARSQGLRRGRGEESGIGLLERHGE